MKKLNEFTTEQIGLKDTNNRRLSTENDLSPRSELVRSGMLSRPTAVNYVRRQLLSNRGFQWRIQWEIADVTLSYFPEFYRASYCPARGSKTLPDSP